MLEYLKSQDIPYSIIGTDIILPNAIIDTQEKPISEAIVKTDKNKAKGLFTLHITQKEYLEALKLLRTL